MIVSYFYALHLSIERGQHSQFKYFDTSSEQMNAMDVEKVLLFSRTALLKGSRRAFKFALGLAFLSACSSSTYIITSTPEGAEVITLQGEVIGKTPLALSSEQSVKILDNNHLHFKIASQGYIPRVVFADALTLQELHLKLVPTGTASFKSEFAKDFRLELNIMLRSSYDIQQLLIERKFAEAKASAEKFKADYPQLAYGYMIAAHLALREGKREEARSNVIQAKMLDPDDPAIGQAFQLLRVGSKAP